MTFISDWTDVILGKPMRGDILSTDKHRLEKEVEKKWCDTAKRFGWKAYKFSSPGNSSVPDRMFIRNGFVFFIEFKRPGGAATPNQVEEHKEMREKGMLVWVIDYFDKEFAEWIFE
ncbi:Phage protein [Xylella phage Bacata]|nr:endonuclease [Xylella phage Bacata]CAA2367845.1 Phage protein [Xylella phage Bacata]